MNLTSKLADKIAANYDRSFTFALHDMIREKGLAVLTDEARRELIVKLGADRRATNARNLWNQNGGDTSKPWSAAYREWLNSAFRNGVDPQHFADAAE